jgi:hypothetical protein
LVGTYTGEFPFHSKQVVVKKRKLRRKALKQILVAICSGILVLTACAPEVPVPPISVTREPTEAPSSIPTNTSPSVPTTTPTASITPLPTIPTFTPTFDTLTVITVTPAPKAECLKTTARDNPNLDFLGFQLAMPPLPEDTEKKVLEFLNQYDASPLIKAVQNHWDSASDYFTAIQDFTNDGTPDLAIGITAFYIFGCRNGRYETLLEIETNQHLSPAAIISIEDNNHNGIPEITFLTDIDTHGGKYYQIYEWNGSKFANLIPSKDLDFPEAGEIRISNSGELRFEDVSNDAMKELIVDSGIPIWDVYYSGFPWRNERIYYTWNGRQYEILKQEFSDPEFRFQAVQNGDFTASQKVFDKAEDFYQKVIFSETLRGYSPEIRENLQKAYAYYRIMLLHLVQENEAEAETSYKTLQDKFGNDPYAQRYLEMATVFWDTYQSTHKMYDGCAVAIKYAAEHPEILVPLGSDFHGWQSHTYVPADVCPFR